MTDRTLPLLFVNLGGEMLYIIEDRLTNQEIASDKTKKGEQNRKSIARNTNIKLQRDQNLEQLFFTMY